MAVYTDFIFFASLKKEIPKEVVDHLLYLMGEGKKPETLGLDIPVNPLAGGNYQPANKMWFDNR